MTTSGGPLRSALFLCRQPFACDTDLVSEQASHGFYDGALPRVRRVMAVLAVATIPVLLIAFGWRVAAGFVVGSALSFYNFHALGSGTSALADRITASGKQVGSSRIVARFLLRYVVIAVFAYGIFSVSLTAFYGLVGGLFLPIAGVGCEAVYELYVALRRGF